jgi:hypothetical protein
VIRRVPWVVAGAPLTALVAAHVLNLATRGQLYEYWLESTIGTTVYTVLGALIVSRQPENVIGRLFLLVGMTSALQFLSGQYGESGMAAGPSWPGTSVAAVLSTAWQFITVSGFMVLAYLFPNGRLPSPRWKPIFVIALGGFGLSLVGVAFAPGPVEGFPGISNPLGLAGAREMFDLLGFVAGAVAFPGFLFALLSLVVRFKRAQGPERMQVKVVAYGTILGFLIVVFGSMLVPAEIDAETGSVVWTIGPLMIPVSAGLAILRYRHFDIDLVINRTLVYGFLTAILAAVYVLLVFGLQAIMAPVTAESDLAVAASTLVVATLFRPLRRGVQGFIDKRFYRRKFNAQRTLDSFNERLRDDVDLGALSERLQLVVEETMQPAHVSLWLRGAS